MENNSQSDVWEKVQASSEFKAHKKKYRSFAFPMAVGFLVWYFSFILLTTFARDFVNTPVVGVLNVAFVLAILQFVTTFAIAWLYDRYSTKNLDGPGEKLKAQVESELQR